MVIVTGYVEGESYGLLGPQLAASIIQENTIYDCIVVTVTRDDDKNHPQEDPAGLLRQQTAGHWFFLPGRPNRPFLPCPRS